MKAITCPGCRHDNDVGARTCEICSKPLAATAIHRAVGSNPILWVKATAVGQIVPFGLVLLLLIASLIVGPSGAAWRHLLLTFGLVGMVTLAVTFPLLKGQYDFAAGPLAGLAACCAVVLSPFGVIPALAGALAVGGLVGLINGILAGWTRVPSAMVTIVTGAIALQVTVGYTAQSELLVRDPFLTSLGETDVLGLPVILVLFVVTMVAARLLLNQPTFWAVGSAPTISAGQERATPPKVMASFIVSGLIASLAGLLIASCGLAGMGLSGQVLWLLTPLAAALIGGASVAGGSGNLRTAAAGAAVVSLTNWLCVQLRTPIAGPIAEAPYLAVGLLADRWKNMTYYMIQQARRGNLFAIPDELRLPMVTFLSRTPSVVRQAIALVLLLAVGVGVWAYVGFYVASRVPDSSAIIARAIGSVEVRRNGEDHTTLAKGREVLHPGDTVYTALGSEASLRFHDGSEVRVYPNSELEISELSLDDTGLRHTRLRMAAGALFARVHQLSGSQREVTVQTPILTLGVRGGVFEARVGQRGGQVAVGEGEVEVLQVLELPTGTRGKPRIVEDIRRIEAGQAMETAPAGLRGFVRRLEESEVSSLLKAADDITRETTRDAFSGLASRWFTVLLVVIIALYVWFVFIYCRPAPPSYLPELIAKRGERLLSAPTMSKEDLPGAVALSQMALRLGDFGKAVDALELIVKLDQTGDDGHWARKMLSEIQRRRK